MFVIGQFIFVSAPISVTVCMVSKSMGNNTFNCFFNFFWIPFVLGYGIGKAFNQIIDDLC